VRRPFFGIAGEVLAAVAVLFGIFTVVVVVVLRSPETDRPAEATIALAAFLVLAALGLLLRSRLSVPIRRFEEDLQIVTRGNLDHKIVVGWNDELSALAARFNDMTEQLKGSRDRLREYNRTLEVGVEQRTRELARRNLELNRTYREKEQAYEELQATQAQMIQQERMVTLGQLLAGIAHEINNPVNFMVNAITPLEDNVGRIHHVLQLIKEQYGDELGPEAPAELDQVMEDIEESVHLIRAGADRTANIVANLRTFSRTQEVDYRPTDLVAGIEITLSLLAHTIKGRIEVERELEDVPFVECVPGEINQVFMNLLSNACQAISGPGRIWIRAQSKNEGVSVFIQDDGCGIAEDKLKRVFDPFFTTKPAGIGTGLGLAITSNIVQRHGGRVEMSSVEGEGTEFEVWLPLRQDPERWDVGAEARHAVH